MSVLALRVATPRLAGLVTSGRRRDLGRLFGCLLCGALSGERCALSASLETARSCTGPTQRVPFGIGDGHRRVVERRVNVGDPIGHVSADSFLLVRLCHCKGLSGWFSVLVW